MTWLVEDGKVIQGILRPVFKAADLKPGMEVQIVYAHRVKTPKRATIYRVHHAWHDQSGQISRVWPGCWSDDAGPVTPFCHLSCVRDPEYAHTCIHVKYRNGRRAIVDHIVYVRPLDGAVIQLAKLVSADPTSDQLDTPPSMGEGPQRPSEAPGSPQT